MRSKPLIISHSSSPLPSPTQKKIEVRDKMTDNESTISTHHQSPGSNPPPKKKRNLPGTPDPEAEVIALSPKTLMATNRFLCEICGKGFQRDQNLQLHRRGHNLPWKLKQRAAGKEARKRVYVCPEKGCVHHHATRALGDLTGIKKHFCRKHGEKKWKCEKCSKRYAVQSDWKAHAKTCGTREYKCDCGTIFSRRDSFITHRAFCDALAQETARVTAATHAHFLGGAGIAIPQPFPSIFKPIPAPDPTLDPTQPGRPSSFLHDLTHPPFPTTFSNLPPPSTFYNLNWDFTKAKIHTRTDPSLPIEYISDGHHLPIECISGGPHTSSWMRPASQECASFTAPSLFGAHNQNLITANHEAEAAARMSATALLQKAAQIGATEPGAMHERLCGLYSTSSVTSGFGSDVESSVNENNSGGGGGQREMYRCSKRRRLEEEMAEGGETRDFLGVGISSICHPSSINGWI